MTSADEVFLARYDRLRQLVASDQCTLSELLELSAILRQLLVDEEPLIVAVNRHRKLRLRYRVADLESAKKMVVEFDRLGEGGKGATMGHLIITDMPRRRQAVITTLARFIANPVLYADRHWYSARDVIKMCANRLGGVHHGEPASDDADEARLRALNSFIEFEGFPAVYRILRVIGRDTVLALEPLRKRVEDDRIRKLVSGDATPPG